MSCTRWLSTDQVLSLASTSLQCCSTNKSLISLRGKSTCKYTARRHKYRWRFFKVFLTAKILSMVGPIYDLLPKSLKNTRQTDRLAEKWNHFKQSAQRSLMLAVFTNTSKTEKIQLILFLEEMCWKPFHFRTCWSELVLTWKCFLQAALTARLNVRVSSSALK